MSISPDHFLSAASAQMLTPSLTIMHLKALWRISVRKPNKATCQIIVKQLPAAENNQAALTSSYPKQLLCAAVGDYVEIR